MGAGTVPVLIVDDQAPFRRAARAVVIRDARLRGRWRGRERGGGRRARRHAQPRAGSHGHQPAGHQRDRGHPQDHGRAPGRRRHARFPPTRLAISPPMQTRAEPRPTCTRRNSGPRVDPRRLDQDGAALIVARVGSLAQSSDRGMRPRIRVPAPGVDSTSIRPADGSRRGRSCSRSRGPRARPWRARSRRRRRRPRTAALPRPRAR